MPRVKIYTGTRCFLPRVGHRPSVEVVVLYFDNHFAVVPLVVEHDGITLYLSKKKLS